MFRDIKLSLYENQELQYNIAVMTSFDKKSFPLYNYADTEPNNFIRRKVVVDKVVKILYFYKNKSQVIVSTTSQTVIQYQPLFSLQIQDQGDSYLFRVVKAEYVQKKKIKKRDDSDNEGDDNDSDDEKNCPQPYLVVRSFKEVQIKEKMKLRLAKTSFVITKLKLDQNPAEVQKQKIVNNRSLPVQNQNFLSKVCIEKASQEDVCRFCFDGKGFKQYLVSLCSCSGSSKWIHLHCIYDWIHKIFKQRERRQAFQNQGNNKFCCSVCTDPYPQYIHYDDKIFKLLEKKCPLFISFKSSIVIQSKNISNEKEMIIGRQKNLWYRYRYDQRIAQNNCVFKFDEDFQKLYISDLSSQYGTLISHKYMGFKLPKNNTKMIRSIQFQNILILLSLQKK